jgi:thiol-disulfide isomerase/thioredoxin
LKLFKEVVTDKKLIEKAQEKYQKDLATGISPNLNLLTSDKKQITIEELLKKKKGKVLYIDFWASWCRPCIEEMKYSKNHVQTYKNKNLEILFLSLDDNFENWNKASERLEISKIENSLKIVNPEISTFIKEHKLYTIPRYMIFNKQGVLINDNAPRPSDLKISKVFDELLKE